MPAAAVIPAPIAYMNIVAAKKLVVEFRDGATGLPLWCAPVYLSFCLGKRIALHWVCMYPGLLLWEN